MILTDEDVKALKLEVYGPHKCAVEVDVLRTVLVKMTEAVLLEKLRQQEPVAWAAFADNGNIRIWTSASETMRKLAADNSMELPPLYAAPVPAAVPDDVVKQRDELLAALEQFATWGRMQHKAQSKGCHATFDMMALKDEIDLAEAAIASVKGIPK